MTFVGYTRILPGAEDEASCTGPLEAAGCGKVFIDRSGPGAHHSRPQLDAALAYMRNGDTLVITRLSRAARSLASLLVLTETLRKRGITLQVLEQDIDMGTFAAVSEFQRELTVANMKEGHAAARDKGKHIGGKPKISAEEALEALRMLSEQGDPNPGCKLCAGTGQVGDQQCACIKNRYGAEYVAAQFGISRASLYRAFERLRESGHEIPPRFLPRGPGKPHPHRLTPTQAQLARKMYDSGEGTMEELAAKFRVGRATLDRAWKRLEQQNQKTA